MIEFFDVVQFVFAQESLSDAKSLKDVAAFVIYFFARLAPIIISLAVVSFLWGVTKTIYDARISNNAAGIETGKKVIVYSIIAITVAVSLWAVVGIVVNTFFSGPSSGGDAGGTIPNCSLFNSPEDYQNCLTW